MDLPISFTKNNIKLRALEPEDTDILYEWENDPEVWRVSNVHVPFSRDAIRKFVQNFQYDIYQSKQVRWMIDLKTGSQWFTIGAIDLYDFDPHNRRAGIGILIKDRKHRGKGYASDALSLIIDYCFKILNLNQVYCSIPEYNASSILLFEKHHFIRTGERKQWLLDNGQWVNELFMQRLRSSGSNHD